MDRKVISSPIVMIKLFLKFCQTHKYVPDNRERFSSLYRSLVAQSRPSQYKLKHSSHYPSHCTNHYLVFDNIHEWLLFYFDVVLFRPTKKNKQTMR